MDKINTEGPLGTGSEIKGDIKDFEKAKRKPVNVNKCEKLPSTATAQERKDAHKVKMEAKRLLNEYNRETYQDGRFILANISQWHEHYGDTPAAHEARKIQIVEKSS